MHTAARRQQQQQQKGHNGSRAPSSRLCASHGGVRVWFFGVQQQLSELRQRRCTCDADMNETHIVGTLSGITPGKRIYSSSSS